MTRRFGIVVARSLILLLVSGCLTSRSSQREPIIDMHLHAHTLSMYGTPPPTICTNDQDIFYPPVDPREPGPLVYEHMKACRARLGAPSTDEELLRTMLQLLARYNIWRVLE